MQSYTYPTPLRKLSVWSFNCCLTRTNSTLVIKDVAADTKINKRKKNTEAGAAGGRDVTALWPALPSATREGRVFTNIWQLRRRLLLNCGHISHLSKSWKIFLKALSASASSGHQSLCPLRDKLSVREVTESRSHGQSKVTDKVTGRLKLQIKVTDRVKSRCHRQRR